MLVEILEDLAGVRDLLLQSRHFLARPIVQTKDIAFHSVDVPT